MILVIIWFATKAYQPLIFVGLPNLYHDKFWSQINLSPSFCQMVPTKHAYEIALCPRHKTPFPKPPIHTYIRRAGPVQSRLLMQSEFPNSDCKSISKSFKNPLLISIFSNIRRKTYLRTPPYLNSQSFSTNRSNRTKRYVCIQSTNLKVEGRAE